MRALLVVAHGSRNPQANAEMVALFQALMQLEHRYDQMELSFLEITTPTIMQGIECLAEKSVQKIDLLPYFLTAGNHVAKDIPKLIEQAKIQYPDTEFTLLPHIGSHPQQAELILQFLNAYH